MRVTFQLRRGKPNPLAGDSFIFNHQHAFSLPLIQAFYISFLLISPWPLQGFRSFIRI